MKSRQYPQNLAELIFQEQERARRWQRVRRWLFVGVAVAMATLAVAWLVSR